MNFPKGLVYMGWGASGWRVVGGIVGSVSYVCRKYEID